jgi:hypothetical protein
MLKTGIYVDAENIKMSGGYGMRYDVLVDLANRGESIMLRANCYLAEDRDRTRADAEYRQKVYSYHNILRQCGFKVIKKFTNSCMTSLSSRSCRRCSRMRSTTSTCTSRQKI